jgi:hypothetical protein
MAETTELNDFLEQVRDEVLARAVDEGGDTPEALRQAFTEILVEDLAEHGAVESPVICPVNEKAGRGNAAADAIEVHADDGRVDILVTAYRGSAVVENLTATEIAQICKRARNLFNHIGKGWEPSAGLHSDGELLFEHLQSCFPTISELRIIVLTDCASKASGEVVEQDGALKIRTDVWDIQRLHRIRNSGKEYESVEIDVLAICPEGIPCLSNPVVDGGYETHLALIPGQFLRDVYESYGPRLLELNVRSFLQLRGAVNKGIRETLINDPGRFLAYNNGLTATVEEVTFAQSRDGVRRITGMKGFQVVNGAQTMATIHATCRSDMVDLTHVQVQAKITCLTENAQAEGLVPMISKFANTQNRVNAADLSANDPLQVQIEQLSETTWAPGQKTRWFYERARGQYQVARAKVAKQLAQKKRFDSETPSSRKFTKTDLAKYLNCWDQAPHTVSTGAQKNFTSMMKSLSGLTVDESWYRDLIGKAIVYKSTEKIARELKLPAYRANAIAYTIAYLAYRSLGRIDLVCVWESQAISPALDATIRHWMPAIHADLSKSAGSRNVTEWCKREACWRHIQTMDLGIPTELEAELAVNQPMPNVGSKKKQKGVGLTSEERENIARVMAVPPARWLELHGKILATEILSPHMAGIVHTLLGYASGKWEKVPSAKQANAAIGIIDTMAPHMDSHEEQ